ncbi:MAG: sigma-70 family RNA polymerase sigma factor [Defluviitaleaceae bacterium]|nr:sigma-70 family RNA polymerase sigma factor [Defluviitaleaceae bacterium]
MPEFENIVEQYAAGIVRYCYNLLGCFHEAEDAMQDVFIRAYGGMGGVRDPGGLRGWLYRIAYNVCMDALRRKKRAKGLVDAAKAALEDSRPKHQGISDELQSALNAIKPADRALFYSRAVDGLDYSELAKIHKAPAATLRKRYERARKKLAELLKEE